MGKATRTKILIAAAELFEQQGFDNTSIRDITKHAGVHVSALSYHFRDKENLVRTIITENVEKLNRCRLSLLNGAISNSQGSPSLEQIVEAFIAPLLIPEIHKSTYETVRTLTVNTLNQNTNRNPNKHPLFTSTIQKFLSAFESLNLNLQKESYLHLLRISSATASLPASYSSDNSTPSISSPPNQRMNELHDMVEFICAGFKANMLQKSR